MKRKLGAWAAGAVWVCTAAFTFPCTAEPLDKPAPMVLLQPKDDVVVFTGLANFDAAGVGANGMAYPGIGGVAGFLAAVVTHGVLVSSMKDSQRARIQSDANQVLVPYQPLLSALSLRTLYQTALDRMALSGEKRLSDSGQLSAPAWLVEAVPAYAITQDQRALVLDAAVTVYAPNEANAAALQRAVRVVSHPLSDKDPKAQWLANEGALLKSESAGLLAEALGIAVEEAQSARTANDNVRQRTVRYLQGAEVKVERAELLRQTCTRWLLRTLRGEYMSVVPANLSSDECGEGRAAEVR